MLGMGKRLMGGGLTRPQGAACAFLGSVPPEAESRRCAHTASDIIIILIMKGQLLQSSSPLRRRERGMQSGCVSLIPSSRGEDTAMPGRSSAGPLTRGDRKRARFPLGALPAVSLGAWGSLHENRVICDAPGSCPHHCPVQALLSPCPVGKGCFGCQGKRVSRNAGALCPSFSNTNCCAKAFSFRQRIQ